MPLFKKSRSLHLHHSAPENRK